MDNNNIRIEEKMANYITACLLCVFLRGILGDGEETKKIIKNMQIDEYTYQHIYEFLPAFDENFFTNMIAILAGDGAVCEELNRLRLSSKDLETMVKERGMVKLRKIS